MIEIGQAMVMLTRALHASQGSSSTNAAPNSNQKDFGTVLANLRSSPAVQQQSHRVAAHQTGSQPLGSLNQLSQPTTGLKPAETAAESDAAHSGSCEPAGTAGPVTVADNYGFGYRGIPENMGYDITRDGFIHLYRKPGAALPWDNRGLFTAIASSMSASMVPDASGLIDGKPAPGLEGWSDLVSQPGGRGRYHGYKGFLNTHYPGGYDQWRQDYETLRRNVLLGENKPVNIVSTSGIS